GNVLPLVVGIFDVGIARKCVRGAERQMIRNIAAHENSAGKLISKAGFQTRMSCLRRIAIRRYREWRTREWLDVDVQNFVLQLDVVRRYIPSEADLSAASAKLILPGALTIEIDVAGNGQAIQLQQKRRLVAATSVAEDLGIP